MQSGSGFGFSAPLHDIGLLERDWSKSDAATARQASERSSQEQMQFQERMSNTAYQRATADMQAAGLNPMLAYQHGGASSPSGSSFSAIPAARTGFTQGTASFASAAQIENIRAQTEKTRAETESIHQDVASKPVTRELVLNQMRDVIEQINRTREQTGKEAASAENLRQQTENLREIVPQIKATIDNLRASTLDKSASAFLKGDQGAEIRQRIAQDLPKLEALLRQLNVTSSELSMPGRRAEAYAQETPAGITGAILRILNPLNGFINSMTPAGGGLHIHK